MTENFSSDDRQLSLVELSDISVGKDGDPFTGKQVGVMTKEELLKFYKDLGLNDRDYCFYDGNVAFYFEGSFFPTTFKLQAVG
jgi:hypothetical protein